jgi:hypothetical protein
MAKDQIRFDDLTGALAQQGEHGLGPEHLDLEILGPRMHRRHGAGGRQPVAEARHSRHSRSLGPTDRLDLIASGEQGTHKMPVLARKILMDDQNFHRQTLISATL